MNQPPLFTGNDPRPLEAFQCRYCLDVTAVARGGMPIGWGKSPTGTIACERCRNTIDVFTREIAESSAKPLAAISEFTRTALETLPAASDPDPDDAPPEPC